MPYVAVPLTRQGNRRGQSGRERFQRAFASKLGSLSCAKRLRGPEPRRLFSASRAGLRPSRGVCRSHVRRSEVLAVEQALDVRGTLTDSRHSVEQLTRMAPEQATPPADLGGIEHVDTGAVCREVCFLEYVSHWRNLADATSPEQVSHSHTFVGHILRNSPPISRIPNRLGNVQNRHGFDQVLAESLASGTRKVSLSAKGGDGNPRGAPVE